MEDLIVEEDKDAERIGQGKISFQLKFNSGLGYLALTLMRADN